MSQLSRPYQVALAAIALLALLWFAVLRTHGSPSGAPSATSAPASTPASVPASSPSSNGSTAAAEAKQAATPTPEYHGSLPGMKGLSRAIRKAHEAVGASQREAAALQSAAVQSSTAAGEGGASSSTSDHSSAQGGASTATGAKTQPRSGANSPTSSSGSAVQAHSPAGTRSTAGGSSSSSPTHKRRSRPAQIASELHRGKIVLLLFWNPRSADDVSVHGQLGAVSRSLKGKVAIHYAKAREVGSFGTVTRNISVNQTPTLLVIGKHGLVTTITGLTDAFSIEQAVREAGG